MFIATVIAAGRLTPQRLSEVHHALEAIGAAPGEPRMLDEGSAADVPFARWPASLGVASTLSDECDVVPQVEAERDRRLLVSDMDSTMITVECIDELADYAGCKAEVAAVTNSAMRGELDFAAALRARMALLEGLPGTAVDACLRERVRPMAGAATLMATLRARGVRSVLVSGGFTRFAEPVARTLGFDRVVANRLEESGGRLTGRVLPPLIDGGAKVAAMKHAQADWGLNAAQTLAVGDGANDLPMIRAAGLGIAYRAKPVVETEADAALRTNDLTALLWVLGLPRRSWVEAGASAHSIR